MPCAAASGFWLFVAESRCPLLCLVGALRRWCPCLAVLPAALLFFVVSRGALLLCAVSSGAVLPCGAVLSWPAVFLTFLLVFVCSVVFLKP